MDTMLKFLLAFLFISLIVCDDESCKKFECGQLDQGICSYKNGTSFTLQSCKRDDQSCNFQEADKDSCETISKPKSYPGGSCIEPSDCIEPNCFGGQCVGIDLGLNCTHHGECIIGTVCRLNNTEDVSKMCLQPLNQGDVCIKDEDCDNTCGCLQGKCTKYFSQKDDAIVTNANFCQSGFELNNTCATISNVNPIDEPCSTDAECKYKFANGTDVPLIEGSCQCGLNKEGNRYCKLGSDNQYYKDWVSSSLFLLNDTSKCHTTERDSFGVCVERTLTDRSFAYRKNSQYSLNNMTIAHHYFALANSDSCVKYVAFSSYNDSRVLPDVNQCPKYSCDYSGKSCFVSSNPFNEDGSGIKVSLANTCGKNEQCQASNSIYLEDTVLGKCVKKGGRPDVLGVRFPGEDCDENHNCIVEPNFTSTCVDKKCSGKKENEVCSTTTECLVGLYCNGTICLPQVKEGKECKDIYDCSNNLGCYKGKCVEFGNLKENDDISFEAIGEFTNDPRKSLFCEYGQVSFEDQSFCAVYKYANETAKNVTSDGFAKCNWGDKCSYTDGKTVEIKDCTCGYNSQGQGYCPLSQEYYQHEWKNSVRHQISKLNNKCHSASRFECYKNNDNVYEQDIVHEHKTTLAHVFYNSVQCAYDVLSGSNFGISVIIFLMTLFTILF